MMDKMRAASKSWVAAILIGFLILSFAIWGINDIFTSRSSTTIARVGASELDYRTFEQEFRNRTRRQIDASGRPMTIEEAREMGYDRIVLNDMIKDMAVLEEAKRLGLGVSDAMVRQALVEIPGLARNGVIDPATFQQFLQQIQMSEAQLVQLLRENLLRDQLARTAMVGAPAPRGMAIALGAYQAERRSIEYVVFPAEKAGEIAAPDDKTLEAFMQANAAAYTTPELRTVTVLTLDAADIAAKIDVTDAEIASEYEVRKATYETLELRELEQISFPTKEDAEAAKKAIDDGKSFADIAKERGLTDDDIKLGSVQKGDTTVPAGAFEIAEGAVSAPLEGPFGWVLIRAVKVTPGSLKPLDAVKSELRDAIALEHALVRISDETGKIEDALAAADSLESVPALVGDALPLKVVKLAPMDARGNGADGQPIAGAPDGDTYLNDVFMAQAGDVGQIAETPKHILYVARVDQITPPALKTLADSRDLAVAAWMLAERAKALAAVAASFEEKANAASSDLAAVAAETGLEGKSANDIARDGAVEGLSPTLVAQLFATPQGKWITGGGAELPNMVLARVKSVTAEAGEDPRAAERAARGEITRAIGTELSDAYFDAIVKNTKVEIDEALFTQLKTRQQ